MLYAISVVCMYVCYVYIKRSINQSRYLKHTEPAEAFAVATRAANRAQ